MDCCSRLRFAKGGLDCSCLTGVALGLSSRHPAPPMTTSITIKVCRLPMESKVAPQQFLTKVRLRLKPHPVVHRMIRTTIYTQLGNLTRVAGEPQVREIRHRACRIPSILDTLGRGTVAIRTGRTRDRDSRPGRVPARCARRPTGPHTPDHTVFSNAPLFTCKAVDFGKSAYEYRTRTSTFPTSTSATCVLPLFATTESKRAERFSVDR